MKPKCRYNCFKYCPEKPFYIREDYPWGTIKECDEEGCDFWWIDLADRKTGTEIKTIQIGMCIDKWNTFYMKDYGLRALGNQKATEQLRNGLCEEVIITTDDGNKYRKYHPRIHPGLPNLLESFTQQLECIRHLLQLNSYDLPEEKIKMIDHQNKG